MALQTRCSNKKGERYMENLSAAKLRSSSDPQVLAYALINAIHEGTYSRAYALLRQMEREHITLSEENAKEALVQSLCCTLRLFRTTYETLFPNGTDATMSFRSDIEFRQTKFSHIEGSLLLFAAALDRPEHARYLIEKGYDANGLPPHANSDAFPPQTVKLSGAIESDSSSCAGNKPVLFSDCSPLAVAILFGSVGVIDLFLEPSDVQQEENASVCRATAFVLNGAPNHHCEPIQALCVELCVNSVFPSYFLSSTIEGGGELPRFPLNAIVDVCTPELFEQQLRSWPRREEEARAALKALADRGFQAENEQGMADMTQKLRLIASLFPALCRESWSSGFFLNVLCHIGMREEAFADCCLSLLGDTVDLTWAIPALWQMSDKELSALLRRLHGKRLVLNADVLVFEMSLKAFRLLLASAEIEPSCFPNGLSACARWMLSTADMKLLRHPKVLSFLRYEPREALADAVRQTKQVSVRALLLSVDSTPESDEVRAARYANYSCCPALAELLETKHTQSWCDSIFDWR